MSEYNHHISDLLVSLRHFQWFKKFKIIKVVVKNESRPTKFFVIDKWDFFALSPVLFLLNNTTAIHPPTKLFSTFTED